MPNTQTRTGRPPLAKDTKSVVLILPTAMHRELKALQSAGEIETVSSGIRAAIKRYLEAQRAA